MGDWRRKECTALSTDTAMVEEKESSSKLDPPAHPMSFCLSLSVLLCLEDVSRGEESEEREKWKKRRMKKEMSLSHPINVSW